MTEADALRRTVLQRRLSLSKATRRGKKPDGSRGVGGRLMAWKRDGMVIRIKVFASPSDKERRFKLTADSAAFAKSITNALATEAVWPGDDPIRFFRRVVRLRTAAFVQASRRKGR